MAAGGLRVNRKTASTQQVQKTKAKIAMHEYDPPRQDEEFGRPARQSSHARQKRSTGGYGQGIGVQKRNMSSVGARNNANNARGGSKQRPSQYGYQPPQQRK